MFIGMFRDCEQFLKLGIGSKDDVCLNLSVKINKMVWSSIAASIYQGILAVIWFECERIELSKNLYECLEWEFFEYVSKWFSNGDVELCEDLTQLGVEGLGIFWDVEVERIPRIWQSPGGFKM